MQCPQVPCHYIIDLWVCREVMSNGLYSQCACDLPSGFGVSTMCPLFVLQVFNLNAPVPPASETEALNQASQYQNSYNQAFGSQSQHPVEQTEMQSEQLQSGGQTFSI